MLPYYCEDGYLILSHCVTHTPVPPPPHSTCANCCFPSSQRIGINVPLCWEVTLCRAGNRDLQVRHLNAVIHLLYCAGWIAASLCHSCPFPFLCYPWAADTTLCCLHTLSGAGASEVLAPLRLLHRCRPGLTFCRFPGRNLFLASVLDPAPAFPVSCDFFLGLLPLFNGMSFRISLRKGIGKQIY